MAPSPSDASGRSAVSKLPTYSSERYYLLGQLEEKEVAIAFVLDGISVSGGSTEIDRHGGRGSRHDEAARSAFVLYLVWFKGGQHGGGGGGGGGGGAGADEVVKRISLLLDSRQLADKCRRAPSTAEDADGGGGGGGRKASAEPEVIVEVDVVLSSSKNSEGSNDGGVRDGLAFARSVVDLLDSTYPSLTSRAVSVAVDPTNVACPGLDRVVAMAENAPTASIQVCVGGGALRPPPLPRLA